MRRGVLVVCLLGCSLNSAGLGDEPQDLVDAQFDTTVSVADTAVQIDSGELVDVVEAPEDTLDSSMADSMVDSRVPDAKPDTAPEVDAGCKPPTGVAIPCTEIPRREALAVLGPSGQLLDGRSDDFCDVPYVIFDNATGDVHDPNPVPPAVQTTMRIQTAWSSFGLHIHLAIRDDKVQVAPEPNLWQGDSAEIYVAGHDVLTGAFDNMTKDVGAHQIIFAPASGAAPTKAVFFYTGIARGNPAPDRWFHRATAGGYELEIRLPWSDLKASSMAAPVAGKKIALTFGFNQKQDALKAFSVFKMKSTTPIAGCGQPYCDDRLWCTPILNP